MRLKDKVAIAVGEAKFITGAILPVDGWQLLMRG